MFLDGWLLASEEGVQRQCVRLCKAEKVDEVVMAGVSVERVRLLTETTVVESPKILQAICLVHDCKSEGCRVKDGMVAVRVEQELKEVRKKSWKHVCNSVYFLNKFSFANKKGKYYV